MVELDAALAEAMTATSMPYLRLGSVAVVGRHRLVRIGTEPSDAFLDKARHQIALVGRDDDFIDLSARSDLFLHAGNGVSLEIGRDATSSPSRLLGPLTEYEHWISVACRTDDELAEEFRFLSSLTRPHQGPVGTTWERAQLALFDHQDVLNAMSPEHSAAWRGYMATWRLADLEDEIRLKLDAVRDRDRELREKMSNQIATRTDRTITFLTTLTLVSIVTGVATYLINEPRPGVGWRLVLVALTVVVATVIYQRSAYPGRLQQAIVRPMRLARTEAVGQFDARGRGPGLYRPRSAPASARHQPDDRPGRSGRARASEHGLRVEATTRAVIGRRWRLVRVLLRSGCRRTTLMTRARAGAFRGIRCRSRARTPQAVLAGLDQLGKTRSDLRKR